MGYFGTSALDEKLYNDPKETIMISIVQHSNSSVSFEPAAAKAIQEAKDLLTKRPHTSTWAFVIGYSTHEDSVQGIRVKYGI